MNGVPFPLSQLVRAYTERPRIWLENAMLIVSIDVDAGSRELGIINKGKNDTNVNTLMSEFMVGEIEELALPLFVDLFHCLEMPVTFAIRGQIVEAHGSVLEMLLKSSIKHDIGAHGYYHRQFKNLSDESAEKELRMISVGMKRLGIVPKSFVFPRNSVAHLDLLEKYGYKCYRGFGNFMTNCMRIDRINGLYNVHPSLFLDRGTNPQLLKKVLSVCITKKIPLHVWFHLWNYGTTNRSLRANISRTLYPFLDYAHREVRTGTLTFETMLSGAQKVEAVFSKFMG